ncbi:hypothetical protein ACN27J_16705 [Solwaraspora sp. WMMB762]|uniref:hypothetical protein n=1 Tax=Solwaraspora sp. WMMB762 TaxID=3404120 RepID=UPI003B962335
MEQFVCAQVASSVDDYCGRIVEDLGRHAPVTDDDRVAALPRRQAVLTVCLRAWRGLSWAVGALSAPGHHGGGGAADADRCRLQRPGGTAVRAGRACLLGYVRSETARPPLIVGRLPDDACLSL